MKRDYYSRIQQVRSVLIHFENGLNYLQEWFYYSTVEGFAWGVSSSQTAPKL